MVFLSFRRYVRMLHFLARRTTIYSTFLLTTEIRHFTCNFRLSYEVANFQLHTKQCCKCCTYTRLHYNSVEFTDVTSFLLLKVSFSKVFLDIIFFVSYIIYYFSIEITEILLNPSRRLSIIICGVSLEFVIQK